METKKGEFPVETTNLDEIIDQNLNKKLTLEQLGLAFRGTPIDEAGLRSLAVELHAAGVGVMPFMDGYLLKELPSRKKAAVVEEVKEPAVNVSQTASLRQILKFVMNVREQFRDGWFEGPAVQHENKVSVGITGVKDRDDFLDYLKEVGLLNKKTEKLFGKDVDKYQVNPKFQWQETDKFEQMLTIMERTQKLTKEQILHLLAAQGGRDKYEDPDSKPDLEIDVS